MISRELHDEIGQILTGVTVRLAALKREAAVNSKGVENAGLTRYAIATGVIQSTIKLTIESPRRIQRTR